MSVQIPGEVMQFMATVVGGSWPEGDEDALWRLADGWEEAGSSLTEAMVPAGNAAALIPTLMVGEAGGAFTSKWSKISGSDGPVDRLSQLCADLASDCRNAGADIEYTKIMIIGALLALLAEVIALACSLFGAPAIPAAEAATAITVRMIFMELVKQLALKVGTDAAIQTLQFAQGHRDDWDEGKTFDATAEAVKGTAGFAIGGLGAKAGEIPTGDFVTQEAMKGAASEIANSVIDDVRHGQAPGSDNLQQAVVGGITGAYGGHLEHGMPEGMTNREIAAHKISGAAASGIVENQADKLVHGEVGVGRGDLEGALQGAAGEARDQGKDVLEDHFAAAEGRASEPAGDEQPDR